jgi:soluble lytic murein transglycosylase-like protein
MVEGGRPGLESPNKDGSADLGVMQINTLWIAPLARHTGQPESMIRRRLLHDPCFNIATAGAIVRIYLNRSNGNLMQAIGDYHSHTPVRNSSYRLKVLEAAGRLAQRFPHTLVRRADQLHR